MATLLSRHCRAVSILAIRRLLQVLLGAGSCNFGQYLALAFVPCALGAPAGSLAAGGFSGTIGSSRMLPPALGKPMIDAFWLLFIVASLAPIALPGQDMILVMSRSIAQTARAGVFTAAGVSVGLVGHTVLTTLGLGVILRTSEWLFVAPMAEHPTLTVFVLGLAFAGLTFLVKAPVAVFSGALSTWLRARPGVLAWVYRSSGAILVAMGVRLALERR